MRANQQSGHGNGVGVGPATARISIRRASSSAESDSVRTASRDDSIAPTTAMLAATIKKQQRRRRSRDDADLCFEFVIIGMGLMTETRKGVFTQDCSKESRVLRSNLG